VKTTIPATASEIPKRLLGKPFDSDKLQAIREEVAAASPLNREEIARRIAAAETVTARRTGCASGKRRGAAKSINTKHPLCRTALE
jgi:hypothetical protein